MPSQSISAEEFAFDILQVLFDQSLSSDQFLILSDVVQLAAEQRGMEVPEDIQKAAVNYIYGGHYVDVWIDPEQNRCVKINRAGMTRVQARSANLQAQENERPPNYWLLPLIVIILAGAGFAMWKFGVFSGK